MLEREKNSREIPDELLLTVTANFTAEPVGEFLRFWMGRLALGPTRVEFSGYNQVFQELMTLNGLLASRAPGANLLLIRLEDWARDLGQADRREAIVAATRELVTALTQFTHRASRPTVLVLCPPSRKATTDVELAKILQSLQGEVATLARTLRGLSIVSDEDLAALYPVDVIDDPESDREGHIPFTRAYWGALGTMLARKTRSLFQSPHKVIVVDADNTLWGGVVGEVGADQVQVQGEWLLLQEFLLQRKQQGMLLALASKNQESDVEQVFCRPDMVLRREDFVAWKVNWAPKSQNIISLAQELELGLDSFIFLDDNPVECAEVTANCPAVTTLLLPSDVKRVPIFLRHVWAFDLANATTVDEKRTELYRHQGERNQFRSSAASFQEFIDGLRLQVELAPLSAADYDRAAQLTQRTNQFNSSGIRRTVTELASLLQSGERRALLVRARDRFGDYGEVGLAVFFAAQGALNVDNLLVSCRVLGKGVEHRLLSALGQQAQLLGTKELVFPFKPTDRNQLTERFLKSIGARLTADQAFHISSEAAVNVAFDPENAVRDGGAGESVPTPSSGSSHADYLAIATELNSVEAILKAASRHFRRQRQELPNEFVQPRNWQEAKLAEMWQEVLHLDRVGVTDSFLALGGKSLQAASIAARIANEFRVRVPLNVLFSAPTILELVELIGGAQQMAVTTSLSGAKVPSLSPAQQRLWFLDQLIPNRAAYNIPLARRVLGALDLDALEAALSEVALRHEMLRSSYDVEAGSTVLRISESSTVSVRHLVATSEAEALALANKEARRPFDLTHGPLMRCSAISLGSDDHLLVLNVHHIVSDAWSAGVLLREWADAYASAVAGQRPAWAPLLTSYVDYSAWQQERLTAGDYQADLAYWKNELKDAPSLLELPSDNPRPSVMTYQGASVNAFVSCSVRQTVESVAARESCTPFMVLLAAFQAMLYRYSRQEEIVVGVPVAGRTHTSLEEMVGCFVNTLAIRVSIDGDAAFSKHLQVVRGKMLNALAHQELPFEYLVSEMGLERDLSRSPLFQVMLVLQDTPAADFVAEGAQVTKVPLHNGGAKFDLVLEVTPEADGYGLALEFNTSMFLPATAERMLNHFTHLLEHACAAPEISLAWLPLMDENELQDVLSFVNVDNATFENVECLHRWFERRVAASPDVPALSCEGKVLSYGEVNQRANQIAHHLIACGVGPDVLVGLCIDRSPDLVIAILAVLKAGGAYLPIDLAYPPERLAFMLEDAQAPVLLTEKKLLSSLPKHQALTICLDDSGPILSSRSSTNPTTAVTLEHTAYVIYTSGSSGKPKGCVVTHRNVARLMRATEHWYGFNERDVWTLFHSTAFDFSVWEIWGALLYGGRVAIVPFLVSRSPEAFYDFLAKQQVTVLNQTPSAFRQLIQAEVSGGQKELALRYVIFGGEALEMQSLRPWFDRHGDKKPQLVNMYGITETTVHVTYRPISKDDVDSGSVIGVPIPDLQIYILDPQRQPVPIGVPGEMYVGGAGLARGYLHRQDLTAERFIPDHLTRRKGSLLYKTGDLARFLPGHDIEYLGRIDDQVKIRGFRIELGEIESVLAKHPMVREASVMAREDVPGAKRLVAYLVTEQPTPEVSALRDHLNKKVPEYMVPAAFVFLEKLPLTNNGKIDRKALPIPEQQRPKLAGRYVAPRTMTEEKLAAIWSKVLRVQQVGVNDNFFELGGDSILSIQIISLARSEKLKLTPKLLFAHQTVAELAAVAEVAEDAQPIRDQAIGDVPLSPIQQWFFEQDLGEAYHYNQAFLFEVTEPIVQGLLELAIKQVSRQHDALRLRYVRGPEGWLQFYSQSEEPTPFSWIDVSQMRDTERKQRLEIIATSTQATLNLENGPLWRVVYFDFGSDRPGRLLFVVHHLAIDGISWRPLLEDLETAYKQLMAGEIVQLPAKSTSYKVWAERLQQFAAETDFLCNELSYWQGITAPECVAETAHLLGVHKASLKNTEGLARTSKTSLPAKETQALLQQVPAAYNTQINDVLLTALARAWECWTGNNVLFTNLEGHGRENLFEDVDISRTVGWFTSIFPLRLELPRTENQWQPGEALKSVKEQLRQIPQRGIGYGILRYLCADTELSARPEPSMVFNYLGQFDQVVAGSSLFRFARESTGPWHSPKQYRRHVLETNALVIDGRLELSWTYNPDVHSETAIQKFADEFLAALQELIVHCQLSKGGGRTPSDFPLASLDQSALNGLLVGDRDVEDIYSLSPIQTLFFSANPGAAHSAFDQWQCTLRGELNVAAFRRAWRKTLQRHTILRSTIHSKGLREPVQMVHRDVQPPWTIEDWRTLPSDEFADRWSVLVSQDRSRPLALTEAPVMRFALIRLTDATWKFLWSIPPLLLDGWSWPVVFRDVSRLYEAFAQNLSPQLEPVRPYRDYLEWVRRQSSNEAHMFWRRTLAGFRQPTALPGDFPDADETGERYVEYPVRILEETSRSLQSTARRLQLTLNTLVQGAWTLVLNRQNGGGEVVFGAAFAGRPADLSGVESIVGPFVNNLPVRVVVNQDARVDQFFRQLHAQLLELNPFQFTPLMEIQRVSEVPWRHRLFDSVVVFQNYSVDESARRFGGRITIEEFEGPIHTNYPVMLLAEPGPTLRLTLIYDSRTVAGSTVGLWARDLATLLECVPSSLDNRVTELQALLSAPVTAGTRSRPRLHAQSQNVVPPQTEMEQIIASEWQKMFGLERVSIEENFFDLGGHSLLLIQMHALLRGALKIEFPIVTLLEYPTVRSLARHLSQPATSVSEVNEKWRDRALRQKQALSRLRTTLKK